MQERRFKEDAATIVEGWADGSYKLPFSLIDMQFYIYGLGAWVSWDITEDRNILFSLGNLGFSDNYKQFMANLFPIWACRVGLALSDL